jgi:hypothetical protein
LAGAAWRQQLGGSSLAGAVEAAAAAAAQPPRIPAVATKTLAATAMAGAQTTINN